MISREIEYESLVSAFPLIVCLLAYLKYNRTILEVFQTIIVLFRNLQMQTMKRPTNEIENE